MGIIQDGADLTSLLRQPAVCRLSSWRAQPVDVRCVGRGGVFFWVLVAFLPW